MSFAETNDAHMRAIANWNAQAAMSQGKMEAFTNDTPASQRRLLCSLHATAKGRDSAIGDAQRANDIRIH